MVMEASIWTQVDLVLMFGKTQATTPPKICNFILSISRNPNSPLTALQAIPRAIMELLHNHQQQFLMRLLGMKVERVDYHGKLIEIIIKLQYQKLPLLVYF